MTPRVCAAHFHMAGWKRGAAEHRIGTQRTHRARSPLRRPARTKVRSISRQLAAPWVSWLVAFACGVMATLVPTQAAASEPAKPGSGGWQFDLGGRLQLDHDTFSGVYSESGERASETYLRRARIEFSARAFEHWKFDLEIAPLADGSALLDTLVVAWDGPGPVEVSAGRFKPDFGLEQAISSKWVTGIERSAIWDLAPDAFERDDTWGLDLRTHGARHHASVGLYKKPAGHAQALRVAYAPVLQPGRVLHLGASFSHEAIERSDGRIRSRLGVRGVTEGERGNRVTLARKVAAAFDADRAGVIELAWAQGPLSAQLELLERRLGGVAAQTSRIARGQYLQLAWTLTGQARPYDIDGAKFGEIRPAGGLGAWEAFYRYDRLAVDGGADLLADGRSESRAQVHVLGINWYARRNLKLSLNHLWTNTADLLNDAGENRGRALSLRLQLLI